MKKIIKIASSALLTFLITLAVFITVFSVFSAKNKSIFGFRLFVVATGSMQGTIDKDAAIIVRRTPEKDLKVKDIITFISKDPAIKGKYNTHRIERIENGAYITKGTANPVEDRYPVSYSDIAGKVIWHSNVLGAIITQARKPVNMLFLIIIPLALIAFFDIKNGIAGIKKAFKEDADKKSAEDPLNKEKTEKENAAER